MSEPIWIPAILVTLPILAAALPLLLGRIWSNVGWWVGLVTMLAESILVAVLAVWVYQEGPVHHYLGGFAPPVGIELVADELSMLITILIAGFGLLVLAFTRHAGPRGRGFSSVYLLLIGGLMGVTLTGDLFNLFVFIEITGIATYALIAARDHPKAALAALKYLIIGTVGATFYLIGVGYLFAATGTLNMLDVAASLAGEGSANQGELYDDRLIQAGFVFIFAGLATKIALFPVHSWQPDAYHQAPDGVTVLISALVSTVATYALIRVIFSVFTVDFFSVNPMATTAVISVGVLSVLIGSGLAVIQPQVKRMLAYSSVSQFGLIVIAVGIATGPVRSEFALAGAMIHLFGHGIMKGGIFAAVGVLAYSTGARSVRDFADLGRRRPIAAGMVAILGFALVGVPPSIGFIGKWYIAIGAVESGVWLAAFVVFLSTLLTLAYVARLLERLYFVPRSTVDTELVTDGGASRPMVGMLVMLLVIAAITVSLGFFGEALFSAIEPFVEGALNP